MVKHLQATMIAKYVTLAVLFGLALGKDYGMYRSGGSYVSCSRNVRISREINVNVYYQQNVEMTR